LEKIEMKKIWANTIVRNEERYIWYAVKSVVDFVEKVIVYDTGSTDNTVRIVRELKREYPGKIRLREVGAVDIFKYTKMRQNMLEETKSDWVLILDGDEVWWRDSIGGTVKEIEKNGDKLDTIVTPYFNVVGDIFHYQEEKAGRYSIDERHGHVTIRFMNRSIPGLHQEKPHGQHGFYDKNGVLIQDMPKKRRKFLNYPFLHFTHMIRSCSLKSDRSVPKRNIKYKYEKGQEFPLDFFYPEVFFEKKPDFVASPWNLPSEAYKFISSVQTPIRKAKRRLFSGGIGY
jgi:glycosyltransferase involved in cell wall biosynthesis